MPAPNRPPVPTHRALPSPGQRAVALLVLLLAATVGCNVLLDIDEATLGDGDDLGSNADAPDAGALAEAALGATASRTLAPEATCTAPTPKLARDCASCGGFVECDGRCSVSPPPDLGKPCGSCGGAIACNGSCSVPTPSDYGSILPRDTQGSFSCCFVDEVRSYGPDGRDSSGCYPGYSYDGCAVSKMSGGGSVSIVEEEPASCTCRVRVVNEGVEGAEYTVSIRLKRGCQPEEP